MGTTPTQSSKTQGKRRSPAGVEIAGGDQAGSTRRFPTGSVSRTSVKASRRESAMVGDNDWGKPKALAIPKEGYFTLQQGRYGPTYPRTPACHGFTIIAKIKPGTEDEIRAYGTRIEKTIEANPHALAQLQLHYLRWVLFDIGSDKYFIYQGIFDTDFDKYTEDAIELFKATAVNTIFEKLEGFP